MRRREAASHVAAAAFLAIACLLLPGQGSAQGPFAILSEPVRVRGADAPGDFASRQLQHARVREARRDTDTRLRALFARHGFTYPAAEVYLRAFKRERVLELWARNAGTGRFVKIEEYPICALSGELGPKSRQGDEQVPEGFYHIDVFNPWSQYHLSLGLDYPNRADRLRSGGRQPMGGDIFIHGDCKTVGCLPLTDEKIEELYWIAVQARDAGQATIPVHIFPGRMHDAGMRDLELAAAGDPSLRAFWRNLKQGYDYFEQARDVPDFVIDARGRYRFAAYDGLPMNVVEAAAIYRF